LHRRFGFTHNLKQPGERVDVERTDDIEGDTSRNSLPGGEVVFWPGDLLKPDFPKARIMTFGYDTKMFGSAAVNQGDIFSHSKNLLYKLKLKRKGAQNRDIIFIAHSLGGILVKEALRRSQCDPDKAVNKIFDCTTGVLFFGTPHRGSQKWASLGDGVIKIAGSLLRMDMNNQIIRALLPSSAQLELCRDSFVDQLNSRRDSLTVRTFQESKGIVGVRIGGLNELVCIGPVSHPK